MTPQLTEIWRYPIKAIGREELAEVTLTPANCLPLDRGWAVTRKGATVDGSEWARCGNFLRAASVPHLQAVTCETGPDGTMVLRHPDRPDLQIDPARDGDALTDWLAPLLPDGMEAGRLVRAQAQGMTDAPFPSVTLCNMSSHRAVSQRLGRALSIHRWRGNLWFDGLAPWEEFDWIGREVAVGDTVLAVRERTGRCRSTEANPDTGRRDADVLGALDSWDHNDFSVLAEVISGGTIAPGAPVRLL